MLRHCLCSLVMLIPQWKCVDILMWTSLLALQVSSTGFAVLLFSLFSPCLALFSSLSVLHTCKAGECGSGRMTHLLHTSFLLGHIWAARKSVLLRVCSGEEQAMQGHYEDLFSTFSFLLHYFSERGPLIWALRCLYHHKDKYWFQFYMATSWLFSDVLEEWIKHRCTHMHETDVLPLDLSLTKTHMGTTPNYQIQITLFIRLVSRWCPYSLMSMFPLKKKNHIQWINKHCVNLIFVLTLSFIPVISCNLLHWCVCAHNGYNICIVSLQVCPTSCSLPAFSCFQIYRHKLLLCSDKQQQHLLTVVDTLVGIESLKE